MDLATARQQVEVARSSMDLAAQQLIQARDRLRAGVAGTLEVVQAQESVASANESYISGLYTFNLAKIALARAMGRLEPDLKSFLQGAP
jgi:outer membrane protein TolC